VREGTGAAVTWDCAGALTDLRFDEDLDAEFARLNVSTGTGTGA